MERVSGCVPVPSSVIQVSLKHLKKYLKAASTKTKRIADHRIEVPLNTYDPRKVRLLPFHHCKLMVGRCYIILASIINRSRIQEANGMCVCQNWLLILARRSSTVDSLASSTWVVNCKLYFAAEVEHVCNLELDCKGLLKPLVWWMIVVLFVHVNGFAASLIKLWLSFKKRTALFKPTWNGLKWMHIWGCTQGRRYSTLN